MSQTKKTLEDEAFKKYFETETWSGPSSFDYGMIDRCKACGAEFMEKREQAKQHALAHEINEKLDRLLQLEGKKE